MAKEIKTEIHIQATPNKIWQLLIDFENYPTWNPFITSIKGRLELGSKIDVELKPSNSKEIKFSPTITTIIDNRELSWLGQLFLPGLLDGVHSFKLIDNKDGSATLIQSELFKGIFIGLVNMQKTKKGFIEMNKKLKEIAEHSS